jgi:uncharacterized protein YhaN
MRISGLDLVRFGKFTDRRIELPRTQPDLHLIVGPNEAGKSTLRAALADLLFGIETRSSYNFLHQHKDMCLAATIEQNGATLTFRRLKRNRDSLRDPNDRPLPDDRLADFMGQVDRAFFERMFALDRRKLEEGGVEILRAKNDLGRMLFEASAGLASLGPLRQQLADEADSLWGPRKKQGRAYYGALEKFEEAGRLVRASTVRAGDWREAKRRVDDADAALQQAIASYGGLETERGRLERIRRVAPHLRARSVRLAERADLGDVPLLPADAGAQLKAAEVTLAAQQIVFTQQRTLIDKAEAERQRVIVDHAVLGRREAIVRLGDERSRVRDHPSGIAKRQAELQLLRDEVADIIRQLGWAPTDEDELVRRLPSRIERTGIQELVNRHARLAEAARLTAETRAETLRERDELDRQSAGLPDRDVPASLIAARMAARDLGDVEARRWDLRQAAEVASRRVANALSDLRPWAASVADLKNLCLPGADVTGEFVRQEEEAANRLRTLGAQLTETRQTLEQRLLAEAQIRRRCQSPTSDDIVAARAARDGLWSDIRDGRIVAAAAAGAYEETVAQADALADRRYLDAAEGEKLESLRDDIAQLRLKLSQRQAEMLTLEEERTRLAGAWAAGIPDALAGLKPSALDVWSQRRRCALDEADHLAAAEAALSRFEEDVAAATLGLHRAVIAPGGNPSANGHAPLAGLLVEADTLVAAAEKARIRREELGKQRAKLESTLGALADKVQAADTAMADWRRDWADRLSAAHLPPGIAPAAATVALDLLEQLAAKLTSISDLRRNRIATMQRDLDAYAAAAETLAAALAPELRGNDGETIANVLLHRLAEADKAKERLQRATEELAEAHKKIEEAQRLQAEAEADLQPLVERAGTRGIEALRQAIARSEQAATVDAAIAEATRLIFDGGDGLSLTELEAEVAAEDLASIAGRLAELEVQREKARADREQRLLAKNEAEAELARINGAAAAAEAEAMRQEALAELAAATERYITVYVASRLLGWAIERFRAEKQDPLLRRAGEIFRELTLRSFVALSVDYDGETPRLLGRRDGDTHVEVDGMSEGTRDQLYLALRLAAIELHLEKGRPLPFIADDLFVNFDDARAAAGFRSLAALGEKTQVIFLSHHPHLADVARQTIGDGLMVTTL